MKTKQKKKNRAANASDLVELFFCYIWFVLGAQSSEGALDLLTGLDILCLTADHESHVFLQRHIAIPATNCPS